MIRSKNTYELVMKAIEGVSSNELLLDAVAVRVTEALERDEFAEVIADEMAMYRETIERKPYPMERVNAIDKLIRQLRDEREAVLREFYADMKAQFERAS